MQLLQIATKRYVVCIKQEFFSYLDLVDLPVAGLKGTPRMKLVIEKQQSYYCSNLHVHIYGS